MKKFNTSHLEDIKLYKKVKNVLSKKQAVDPVEDIYRSIAIVESVLHDARDLKIETQVVTWALNLMKQDPSIDISDAMIMSYETWVK
jgi:hypothetical protein